MSVEQELKNLLISKLGIEDGSFKLAMAKPVANLADGIDGTDQAVAQKIIDAAIKNLPPEILHQGAGGISNFFSSFGYDTQKEKLIEAVNKVKG